MGGAAIQPQPFGKYFLLEKIATGGMAEIYKAMYRAGGEFEKTLVIKRILPHLANDEEFITMFRDEAKLTVRLNHANVVQVFDFGRHGEDHFLAMEYVQGQNLRQVMRRCQELGATVPLPFALYCCMEVCKGLQYAHTRKDENDVPMGIIHRDITPSNILVSYEGEVKLADFGIAKAESRAGATQAGMIKGKASYLSPEQVAGREQIDHRADVFSLGAVLWELLVGKKLFSGDDDFQIMNRITEAPILPPSKVNAGVPPRIDLVCMMALDRDRTKRYPNAASMQKDLARLLAEFGGNVTTVDIASFLHRLFKKEMEAEKEASKSMRRLVVDVQKVEIAARDGATLNKPDPAPPTGANEDDGDTGKVAKVPLSGPVRKGSGAKLALAAGAGLLAIVAGGAAAVLGGFVELGGRDVAEATPVSTPTAIVETSATPASTATTESLATETPVETAVAIVTPTAEPISTDKPAPTATPIPKASGTPKAAPTGTAVAKATATPKVVSAKGAMGLLKVDSQPWGEIFVDGKSTGRQTPAMDLKLPVGKHKIRLVNSVSKLEATFEVEITEATPVKKVVKLEPAK